MSLVFPVSLAALWVVRDLAMVINITSTSVSHVFHQGSNSKSHLPRNEQSNTTEINFLTSTWTILNAFCCSIFCVDILPVTTRSLTKFIAREQIG
jgi:hypothetical protein